MFFLAVHVFLSFLFCEAPITRVNRHEEVRATTQRRKARDTTLFFLIWFNLISCNFVTLLYFIVGQVTIGERQHHSKEGEEGSTTQKKRGRESSTPTQAMEKAAPPRRGE